VDILLERAKKIIDCLQEADDWVSLKKVAEVTKLTEGQIKYAVKHERRLFLDSPEDCGQSYILSSKKGYKLPKTDDDYVALYKTLYAWGKSVLTTVSPIGQYLALKGYDVQEIRKEAMESHGLSDSIDKDTAWQE